ncbi:hypothetical protein [Noviherbaspirillum sp.]|uniref:hypothetical protein n=1 Tax=Noviherbaspirillum sp. TaxID=1926288 RepID=UPI002B49264D|nr:hypothetical protein [Noviherbaspirillum sp.]
MIVCTGCGKTYETTSPIYCRDCGKLLEKNSGCRDKFPAPNWTDVSHPSSDPKLDIAPPSAPIESSLQYRTIAVLRQWWCALKALITVTVTVVVFLFVPVYLATIPSIRGTEHGPLFALLIWYSGATFVARKHRQQIMDWGFTERSFKERRPFEFALRYSPVVVVALLIGYMSSNMIKEALNPFGYWTAIATEPNPCAVPDTMIRDAREQAVVAANKLRLGIGTTRELRDAKEELNMLNSIFQDCESNHRHSVNEARLKLKDIDSWK